MAMTMTTMVRALAESENEATTRPKMAVHDGDNNDNGINHGRLKRRATNTTTTKAKTMSLNIIDCKT
jgi:hypothetical protein